VSEQVFVVGPDGHVLSKREEQEARQLDEPVSTGDAPDVRAVHALNLTIEANRKAIMGLERRMSATPLSWRR
jgi:hypothetical protein